MFFGNNGGTILDVLSQNKTANVSHLSHLSVTNEHGQQESVPVDASILQMAEQLNSTHHTDGEIGRDDWIHHIERDRVPYNVEKETREERRAKEKAVNSVNFAQALREAFPAPLRPMVQIQSTNPSAVNMAKLLYFLKVKRWYLPLLLIDPDLDGINPHDQNLTPDIMDKVLAECKMNLFYFAREVARVAVAGMPDGAPCIFHMGSFTALYFSTNNVSYYLEQPRQTYKTGTDAIINVWYWNFACQNANIGIFAYKDTKVKENLQEIIKVLNNLPDYLKIYKYKINRDINTGKEEFVTVQDFAKSAQSITNHLNSTKIIAKTTGQTKDTAINAGRGGSCIRLNFDEIGFCKYNWLAYGSAQPSFDEVASVAKQNGLPHCISMTSTPPDATTKEGEWLHKLLFEECVPFSLKMFDLNPRQMKDYLRANGEKDIVFASFMYNELGFNEEWLVERHRKSSNDVQFEVDVLLKWKRDVSRSPFDRRALEQIEVYAKNSRFEEYLLHDKFVFKLYSGFRKSRLKKIIIGCDVAGGGGASGLGDYSTMVGVDPDTTEILFTFRANNVDPEVFSNIIIDFHREMTPNAILVIERNNMGQAVVAKLNKLDDIEPFLYYTRTTLAQDVWNMNSKAGSDKNALYGFVTGQANREIMYKEILHTRVNRYRRLFGSEDIVRELMSVYVTAAGRYDHLPGYHDDLLMAYMFTLYVLYKDMDMMEKFGIGIPRVLDDEAQNLSTGEAFVKVDDFATGSNDSAEVAAIRRFMNTASSTKSDTGFRTLEEDNFVHATNVAKHDNRTLNEPIADNDGMVNFGNMSSKRQGHNPLRGRQISPF